MPQKRYKSRRLTWASAAGMLLLAALYLLSGLGRPLAAGPDTPLPPSVTPGAAQGPPSQVPPTPVHAGPDAGPAAKFDFYVLSLSWSPDYCAGDGVNDAQQCSLGKQMGFVLHGVWPQYTRGYPSDCTTQKLPAALKAQYAGLYPSTSLFDHEWEKHGTCSGLDPASYLAFSQQLRQSVGIPADLRAPQQPLRLTVRQLKDDFLGANPGLADADLAVMCSGSGRYLTELRICFSTAGQPLACSAEVLSAASKSCGAPDFVVRNVR